MRTTVDAVKDILNRDYDSINEPDLDGYIETASAMVDRVITCAIAKDRALTDTEAELIERWLSAHCYALSDRTYKARSTLRASGSMDGQTGMHLDATTYGQMAVTLDPSGCLANLAKKNRVGGFWLGKRPSNQTHIDDRD